MIKEQRHFLSVFDLARHKERTVLDAFARKPQHDTGINFDELRLLARHVLHALREQRVDVPLEDPHDPMIEVEEQRHKPVPSELKVPRLNRDIWERLVDGQGGNSQLRGQWISY